MQEVPLTRWIVLGPFPVAPSEAVQNRPDIGLDTDALTASRVTEAEASQENHPLTELEQRLGPAFSGTLISADELVDFEKRMSASGVVVAYALTDLIATRDGDVAMFVASADTVKIWLNGRLLLTRRYWRSIRNDEEFVRIHLQKGRNRLLVKKTRTRDTKGEWSRWVFALKLLSLDHAKQLDWDYGRSFLDPDLGGAARDGKQILAPGEPLRITRSLYVDEPTVLEITNLDGRLMHRAETRFDRTWTVGLPLLPQGLYRCRLTMAGKTAEELFFVGSPEMAAKAYAARIHRLGAGSGRWSIDLDALLFRMEHMLNAQRTGFQGANTPQQNMVFTLYELEATLHALEHGRDPFKGNPGRHLRAFRSRIDGQVQYYIVTAPGIAQSGNRPMPLLIHMPFTIRENRPVLESFRVVRYDQDEATRRFGEEFGWVNLFPHGRGTMQGTPIGLRDVMETIEEVKKDYRIDEERIYLEGGCAGGRDALLFAARYPHLFAAVEASGPITKTGAADPWGQLNQPSRMAENLLNIPVFIWHNQNDPEVPYKDSVEFVDSCRRAGGKARFWLLAGGDHIYASQFTTRPADEFLKGKQRVTNPEQVKLTTGQLKYGRAYWIAIDELIEPMVQARVDARRLAGNRIRVDTQNVARFTIDTGRMQLDPQKPVQVLHNGKLAYDGVPLGGLIRIPANQPPAETGLRKTAEIEGPIIDAFGDSFLVVDGTQGSLAERGASQALTRKFEAFWQDLFHVPCRVKPDTGVTPQDISEHHLLVIGNSRTNLLLAKILPKLPLELKAGAVRIGGRTYQGKRLGVQMIWPNPLNPLRYVVLLAADDLTNFAAQDVNLPVQGRYDFKVLELGLAEPQVVGSGYFDSRWR